MFTKFYIPVLLKILGQNDDFPAPETASDLGLLAIGGDLSPERLVTAYSAGIFPWFDESQPILWWSPDPRMVLFPQNLKISRSMRQILKKGIFEVSYNQAFGEVMRNCALIPRKGQDGTWITPEMESAYLELYRRGIAQSVEVWKEEKLVAGLYGIYLKDQKIFCGESMFTHVSNGSKYGFIKFVERLKRQGVRLIDCQIHTEHLASLGAEEIPREEFLSYLR